MTVMLLAMLLSDSALSGSELSSYRIDGEGRATAEPFVEAGPRAREWKPGLDGWKIERTDCAVFFKGQIGSFGTFTVGPRCEDEEIPYAL